MNKKQAKKHFRHTKRYNRDKIFLYGVLHIIGYSRFNNEHKRIESENDIVINLSENRDEYGIFKVLPKDTCYFRDIRFSDVYCTEDEYDEYLEWLESRICQSVKFTDIDAGYLKKYIAEELKGIVSSEFIENNPNNSKESLLKMLNDQFSKSDSKCSDFLRCERENPFIDWMVKLNYRDYCDYKDYGEWFIV